MKYALNIDTDGRIYSATYEKYAVEGMPIVDMLPDGDITDYQYINNKYIYNPLPKEEEEEIPTNSERITALEEALTALLEGATE